MGSNDNFRHISDGVNLVPNATTEVVNPGDIDYSLDNGQFNFLTGSGLEQIIGTISTQTLINKTIPVGTNFITSTPNTVAQFNLTTGNLEPSLTTTVELGYVHGVTSNIQSQLNAITSQTYVNSLNSLIGAVSLTAGANITITPSGNSLIIASTGGGGSGTVTSVAFSDASTTPIYSISGSPVTTSGTLTQTLTTQNANLVFAGPTTGSASQPSFRNLVSADIPSISLTSGVSGVLPIANGGTDNGSLPVTAGGVLYTDGTRIQNVGAGTSGQVLTSNGASAPTWQTGGGGGGSTNYAISSSSGNFQLTSTGIRGPVTNLSVTITTVNGNPVFVGLIHDGTPTNSGNIGVVANSGSEALGVFYIVNGSTTIVNSLLSDNATPGGGSVTLGIPVSSLSTIDVSVVGSPGTYTYEVDVLLVVGSSLGVGYAKLIAYELS